MKTVLVLLSALLGAVACAMADGGEPVMPCVSAQLLYDAKHSDMAPSVELTLFKGMPDPEIAISGGAAYRRWTTRDKSDYSVFMGYGNNAMLQMQFGYASDLKLFGRLATYPPRAIGQKMYRPGKPDAIMFPVFVEKSIESSTWRFGAGIGILF